MPKLYIIAGCNGAGKTTASYSMLPEMLNCREFVNADSIAAGISPFHPDGVAFEAGRMMLHRISQLMENKVDFGFETTLATKSYKQRITASKQEGYEIILLFFWLNSPKLAIERVKSRVKKGGHNIPDTIVKRRYQRGLKNLFSIYLSLSDYWMVIDNSLASPNLIAEGNNKNVKSVHDDKIWNKIKSFTNEK